MRFPGSSLLVLAFLLVPLSAVASSPNFLGWLDPTTLAGTVVPAPAGPPPQPGGAAPVG